MARPRSPAVHLVFALAPALVAAGCSSGRPAVVPIDCGAVADASVVVDGATGAACPSAPVDPSGYWPVTNGLFLSRNDLTAVALDDDQLDVQLVVRDVAPDAPAVRGGDCVQYATGLTGGASRNAASDADVGFAAAVQCGFRVHLERSNDDGHYLATVVPGAPLLPERGVSAQFSAASGTLVEAAVLPFPPLATGSPPDPFSPLDGLSAVTDNVVTIARPYGGDDANGLVALVVIFDRDQSANLTLCAVPACQDHMTIPASVVAAWSSPQVYTYARGFARGTDFTTGGRALRLVLTSLATGIGKVR